MLWGALSVGVAGWVCLLAAALSRRDQNASPGSAPSARALEWLALLLPVAVWLATLPTRAPFSPGQGFGRGVLLGGSVAFIGNFITLRTAKAGANSARLAGATSGFGAIIAACVPLLWMRRAVIEALLGAASGWVAVATVLLCATMLATNSNRAQARAASLALLNGAAWATGLFGVCALGVYRDFVVADVARGTHSAIAVTLAASVALSLLFSIALPVVARARTVSLARSMRVISILACVIAPLGIGFLAATRVLDDLKVFECVGVGSVTGLLGWALLAGAPRGADEARTANFVAVLLALCGWMFAYGLEQGFGAGLMLLAAWPVSLLVLPANEQSESEAESIRFDIAQTLSLLGTFLAVLLVSRVFATRFRADLRGANLSDQFALFGFVAGAIVPALLASIALGGTKAREVASASVPRVMGSGALGLLLLSAMIALWGVKVGPAFFAGLALGLVFSPRATAPLCALFSLSLCLVTAEWTGRFLPLAEVSRAQRTHFLLWGLGAAAVLVLVFDLGARLLARVGSRGAVVAAQEVSQ